MLYTIINNYSTGSEKGGAFLTPQDQTTIPPLIRLGELLGAATRVLSDEDNDSDLRLLLAPGSSLGGARAKASVLDNDGTLSIAKFPQADDTWSVTLWEAVALDLAARAGIPTPAHRIEKVSDRNVLILKRFDRNGQIRIPFLSAMSMLAAADTLHFVYCAIAMQIGRIALIIHKPLCSEFIEHLGVGVRFEWRVHFVIDGGVDVVGVACNPVQPICLLGRGGGGELAHRFQIAARAACDFHITQGNL